MKTYKVNVNGTEYAISIELMSEEEAQAAKTQAPKAEAAPVRKVERVAPVAKAESNDGDLLDYANSFYRKK